MATPVELILYAEPAGELGARCAEFWAAMSAADAATDAQTYPPHVTLTGWFRRDPDRMQPVREAFTGAIDTAAPRGLDGVRWVAPATLELHVNHDWAGFHVTAPWMDVLVAAFAAPDSAAQPTSSDEDPLRPKSRLHLSLAYGAGYDEFARTAAAEHTAGYDRLGSEGEWTIALWRRDGSAWARLTPTEDVRATP